jgi:putative SOS response-associated peptidase YedK
MCGRYAASRRPEDMVEEFEVEVDETADATTPSEPVEPNFNVAPTDLAPVVLERASKREASEDGDPAGPPVRRRLRLLKWGLVPGWSKDASGGARMINARAESLFDKPAFKTSALTRRCLVPADGWYEWQVSRTGTDRRGKPVKQPFFLRPADGAAAALAGIYAFWRAKDADPEDPAAWLTTYAIITTEAEPGLDVVHDRMPFVMPRDRWEEWLDPDQQDADAVAALLAPPQPGRFVAYPISTAVNNVANNGPELLEPVPVETVHGIVDPMTGQLW